MIPPPQAKKKSIEGLERPSVEPPFSLLLLTAAEATGGESAPEADTAAAAATADCWLRTSCMPFMMVVVIMMMT